MRKISTGEDATLGTYRKIASAIFGEGSKPVNFFDEKIENSPKGLDEEVIADESQVIHLIMTMGVEVRDEA